MGLKLPKFKKQQQNIDSKKTVSVDKRACSSYLGQIIKLKNKGKTPQYIKKTLKAADIGQVNTIVDITNYVMFDLNRPLHAYDADKIDKEIIVRNSKKGEYFEGLDNKEYKLNDDMCVISDRSGVLGLGGIIGGTRSGTEFNTKNILLESAYFNPRSIRKTSKLLNLTILSNWSIFEPNSFSKMEGPFPTSIILLISTTGVYSNDIGWV